MREQMRARAGHDVCDRLGRVTAPTLVACGRYDGIAPLPNSESIAERIPNAELPNLRRGPRLLRPGRQRPCPRSWSSSWSSNRQVADTARASGNGGPRPRRPRSDPLAGHRRRRRARPTASRPRSTPRSHGTTARAQRPALDKLYEKAKVSQWNGSTDLDWSIDVDPERTAVELSQHDRRMQYVRALVDETGLAGREVGREARSSSTRWRTSRTG